MPHKLCIVYICTVYMDSPSVYKRTLENRRKKNAGFVKVSCSKFQRSWNHTLIKELSKNANGQAHVLKFAFLMFYVTGVDFY